MDGYSVKFQEPNSDFCGVYLSVQFEQGEGFTNSKYIAERLQEKGLSVEKSYEKATKTKPYKIAEER